jgi:hypothetical protein
VIWLAWVWRAALADFIEAHASVLYGSSCTRLLAGRPKGRQVQSCSLPRSSSGASTHEAVVWLMQAVDATLGSVGLLARGDGRHRLWRICRGARGGLWAPAST